MKPMWCLNRGQFVLVLVLITSASRQRSNLATAAQDPPAIRFRRQTHKALLHGQKSLGFSRYLNRIGTHSLTRSPPADSAVPLLLLLSKSPSFSTANLRPAS
ncbi:hypothetical protein EJ06DRAFT_532709 [Trichodelitschia bisporula]|uniref:Secreted protein n=1 Tax=Trichodelitschia bisporula TaxID=703511 RepID=A0A6G1HPF0_9PEZI|nr:hypothetical protein EJ06DRAFT_532709 [Trichodelitschia bisporula]